MSPSFSINDYEAIAANIAARTVFRPKVALVLGSGFGELVSALTGAEIIPYNEIPHFPQSSVLGHEGRLAIGQLEGRAIIVMQGRVHFYEGYDMQHVTLPIRVLRALGVEILILTNAAGGLNPTFHAGDLMLIEDQINLLGMIGHNPLMGPNDAALGPRFPDLSTLYDPKLRELARQVAASLGIPLQRGIYVGLAGPAFETPAEVRFLRLIGGDATGMSTTNEAVVARHGGMRVLGFSGIANVAIDAIDTPRKTTHDEVLEAGKVLVPRLTAILRGLIARLDEVA